MDDFLHFWPSVQQTRTSRKNLESAHILQVFHFKWPPVQFSFSTLIGDVRMSKMSKTIESSFQHIYLCLQNPLVYISHIKVPQVELENE